MKNIDDEIERIQSTLRNLRVTPNPSPEMLDLINYYETKYVLLSRRSNRHFWPYRDEDGELVINADGDRENDI